MSLESPPNPAENLEITDSAKKDIEDFVEFIKTSDISELPNYVPLLSDYIYQKFCINAEEDADSLSKKTVKKYINSMKSVEDVLSNIDGVKLSENYTDWLGYEINGSYDKDGSLGRVYINSMIGHTPEIFKSLTESLQKNDLHCEIKTSRGDENDLSRVEKIVIYFNGEESGELHNVLKTVYNSNSDKFNNKIPRFSRQLGPGIGFGQEPVMPNESFSSIRANILAKVYYKYKKSNFDESFDFVREFQDACSSFQVDGKDPSRNKNFLEN